jgi:tRNA modification GTPase
LNQDLTYDDIVFDQLETLPSESILQSPLMARTWILSLSQQQGTSQFLERFGQELHRLYSIGSPSPHAEDGLKDIQNAQAPIITRARHRVHLESARTFLQAFLECRMFVPINSGC